MASTTHTHARPLLDQGRSDLAALKGSPILSSLSLPNQERILALGEPLTVREGELLFREGDVGGDLYILRRGVVQILRTERIDRPPRVQAHIRHGAVLGDLGVFAGIRHRSSGRAAEDVEVLRVSGSGVRKLLRDSPTLAGQVCAALGYALAATRDLLESIRGTRATLNGSVRSIGFLTLVQTLTSCEELTGRVLIHDERGTLLGSVDVSQGRIVAAACGTIDGVPAFQELVLSLPDKSVFTFRERRPTTQTGAPRGRRTPIDVPTPTLLIEATRLLDESHHARSPVFSDPARRFCTIGPRPRAPEGTDPARLSLVWASIVSGRTLGEIEADLTRKETVDTHRVLDRLLEAGHIRVL